MPHFHAQRPDQVIYGDKTRGEWVLSAAKALIASCDPAILYRIVRVGGFLEFVGFAQKAFKDPGMDPRTGAQLQGFDFTVEDCRQMFNVLERHLEKLEANNKVQEAINRFASETPVSVDSKGPRFVTDSLKHGTKEH